MCNSIEIGNNIKNNFTKKGFYVTINNMNETKKVNFCMASKKEEKAFLTYKGKPLVRRGDTIYYGNFEDKLIITLKVTDSKPVDDLNISTNIIICLQTNDPNGAGKVVRKAERDGFYRALDIGAYWLEDALEQIANMK